MATEKRSGRGTSPEGIWAKLRSPDLTASIVIFVALFFGVFARQAGFFQFDAQHYWDATRSLVGVGATPDGFWELRGVLSAIVFLPAAAISTVLGSPHETLPVLAQNAAVIAAVGAFLLPWVIKEWAFPNLQVRVLGAVCLWFASAHFAPYALVDLYPAFALIATIPLLNRRNWWSLGGAGLLVGIALNLRPAYVIVAILLVSVALFRHRRLGLFVIIGMTVAFVPQFVLNIAMHDVAFPVPIGSGDLAKLQAGYASFTVRYDTIFGDPNARQFYCSPSMAAALESTPVTSLGGLAWALIVTLPGSGLFALQKISASVFWPLNTPYSTPAPGVDPIVGTLIAAVTVVGISFLLVRTFGGKSGKGIGSFLTLMAITFGTFSAIVGSASEARFSLAAVLVGVLGVATLAAPSDDSIRSKRRFFLVTGAVLLVVILLAATGLDHPAPRGEATKEVCASLG